MARLTNEMLKKLAEPFSPDVIDFKPGATNQEKTKALALAYVEVRHYIDRLNEVVGGDWSDSYQFITPTGEIIACGLTIQDVTRWDIGEKESKDVNTATSAMAQSFKRACVKFGLGRHLYTVERTWVPYDKNRKRFTDAALTQLRRMVSGNTPSSSPPPIAPTRDGSDNGKSRAQRPMDAATTRVALHSKAKGDNGTPITEKQAPLLARKFQECFAPDEDAEQKYHTCLMWIWGGDVESANKLTKWKAKAMLDWLLSGEKDGDGDYLLSKHVPEEAKRILKQALVDQGQTEMELDKAA